MAIFRRIMHFINKYIIYILLSLIIVNSVFLYNVHKEKDSFFALQPKYHFYFIGQNAVDPFWKEIRKGIEMAARDFQVVVEFNAPRFNNAEEELKFLDIGITSNVDGIITHISNALDAAELINAAYKKGIPVVTIENDSKSSNRQAFVGTNSFLLGKEAAGLMVRATGGKAKIAIIVSNDFELDAASQNLKINGFLSTIKDYYNMEVVEIYTSKMGILSAEEITQSIINQQKEIDAIWTTNSVDTLGAAQLIVDQNRVGSVALVGYGDTENILRYIKMGIIYGTVMSDPQRMGYEALTALIDIKEKNNVATFIDTGVKVITQENLQEYEERIEIVE